MTAGTVAVAIRSWLYVPATRPDLLHKAMQGEADAVVLDLEDAVPLERKEEARRLAAEAVHQPRTKPLWVRINPVGLPWGRADLAALAGAPVSGLRLPKCESPDEVAHVAQQSGVPLHLLLETALGVERAFALAHAHPRIALVSLGEADLRADLRVRTGAALDWARDRIVCASRAAGLESPVQSVWTDVSDLDGLVTDTERARDRGFFGRSVVHPRQLAPVNSAFTPRPQDIEQARRLIASLQHAQNSGSTVWLDDRGRLIDPAVVAQARWVLERTPGASRTTG